MAVEGVLKGSYTWMRLMLHEDQAQTKSSKVFITWEGMLYLNDYDPPPPLLAQLRHLCASPWHHVCAHAYLPKWFGTSQHVGLH